MADHNNFGAFIFGRARRSARAAPANGGVLVHDAPYHAGLSQCHCDLLYQLWASTNLTGWSLLGQRNSPALPFVFQDFGAANYPQRFYRIQLAP